MRDKQGNTPGGIYIGWCEKLQEAAYDTMKYLDFISAITGCKIRICIENVSIQRLCKDTMIMVVNLLQRNEPIKRANLPQKY